MQSSHSPVFAPFMMVQDHLNVLNNNTAANYYVATTGSNSNDGLTVSTPFLTIQYAIDYVAASLFPGVININLAAGTYNEDLTAKSYMGKNSYVTTNNIAIPQSASVINIIGDNTTPANVVIIGQSTTIGGIFVMENVSTNYNISGVTFQHLTGVKPCAYVTGQQSQLTLNNIAGSNISGLISNHNGSRVFYSSGAAGGTFSSFTAGNIIFCTTGAYVRIDRGFTVSGSPSLLASVVRGGYVHFNTTGQTYTITNVSSSGTQLFGSTNGTVTGFGSGDIINANLKTQQIFLANGIAAAGNYLIQGPCTFNLTDCTGGVARIQQGCTYSENNACTFNYLGTSVATYTLYDGAQIYSMNGFTSAVPTFVVQSTAFRFGYDWRYLVPVMANVPGLLLTAGTGYMTGQGTQATNFICLYIAQLNESVDSLQMTSRVGNGAAHTDTYTVYKVSTAGVATVTTMVLSITNTNVGSTVTNPVALAPGEGIAILATVATGSTAADVQVQANIRKL